MTQELSESSLVIDTDNLPRYIAVEGPIGVGKTTLAKRLALSFNYQILLEQAEENPFLERFYRNRRQSALATQLFFLFQRAQQMEDLRQSDIFAPVQVADFLMEKDRLFARINLDEDEFALYEKVYQQLTFDAPKPDLVVYLQAPVDTLMGRIHERGVDAEKFIERSYLEDLNDAYSQFFLYYDESPLLIINAAEIDFVNDDQQYFQLVEHMLKTRSGRHYFNPTFF